MIDSSAASPNQLPRPSATCQKYLALQKLESLAGTLVVCVGMETAGAEWAIASTLSGAAFLGIHPQLQPLKFSQQQNACDFLVNSLDEAVRILKNEIRKRQPISVGLLGSAEEVLSQLVERGIQPEFLVNSTLDAAATHQAKLHLTKRGAILLQERYESTQHAIIRWIIENPKDVPLIDVRALSVLPAEDAVRRRWVQRAGAYFFRQRPL